MSKSIEFASDRMLLLKGWWCMKIHVPTGDKSNDTKDTKNLEPVP
jgi:hypothetical protein